jgi:hypothetical protein
MIMLAEWWWRWQSVPAMVGGGQARSTARPARTGKQEQPGGAMPVRLERGEQLQHPGVVGVAFTRHREADLLRQVIVAD